MGNNTSCDVCKQPISTNQRGVCKKVIGWAPLRDAGGPNQVIQRRDVVKSGAYVFAHVQCVKQTPGQERMFG